MSLPKNNYTYRYTPEEGSKQVLLGSPFLAKLQEITGKDGICVFISTTKMVVEREDELGLDGESLQEESFIRIKADPTKYWLD